ncbi:MAG TPA: GntR family transcriptional regulator [Salinivirgaceae bacterium]|nr:GntR family transcriptional regulator [Salinivirgaceae bacterium]
MKFNEQQPIYLQIADFMCENILSDKWPSGERIPSVRDVAAALEVNPNTVLRAYDFLQNLDIIFNKRGIGYFVSVDGKEKTIAYKKEVFFNTVLPDIIKTMNLLGIQYSDLQSYFNQ